MMPSLYLTMADRSPKRHATLPTHQIVHSTTPYYKVLLQYNSVLQSTTPVPLCTTKTPVLQNSTPELLQYNSVLQSTTPGLLCTTKFYSSTILYYKVQLQYFSVLGSSTPYYKVLQYYSVLQSTTPYYKVPLRTTKYQAVLLSTFPYYKTTPVLLCTTK